MTTANRPPSVYVDDVFEEVLALPAPERDRAIAERCAGHPSLAEEVRALLAAEEDNASVNLAVGPGASIGRYRLDACLGQGASASVWKAWDSHLRSWTALKLIREGLGRDDALQTVLHEARAASAIISDHVVRIKSAGKIPRGPYYVEMQLCAEQSPDGEDLVVGRTLAEVPVRDHREAARLVMEAARGAEAAHRVGVLHRDIKPANILLMPLSRRALVADFGLSAAGVRPDPTPGTPSTATITIHLREQGRTLVGTPSFMPPEQAWGEPATRANDVYALGATLYALCAGRAPYQAAGKPPAPALEVVTLVREGPPRPLAWCVRDVPDQLVRIVEKAMARNPAHRYHTAAALADDLERFLAHRTTTVDGRRPALAARLFLVRYWHVVSVVAVAAGAITASAAVVTALELRRAELVQEVRSAERELASARADVAAADIERNQAESDRDQALEEREKARMAREIALLDKDRAISGMNAAERRALQEIDARMAAEEGRIEALQLKVQAEDELARQERVRSSLEGELAAVRVAYAEQAAQAEWLRSQLEAEVADKAGLEDDLLVLTAELRELMAKVGRLEAELELQRAGAAAARAALEASEQVAPWAEGATSAPAPATP